MELKLDTPVRPARSMSLLIVPYGIETNKINDYLCNVKHF